MKSERYLRLALSMPKLQIGDIEGNLKLILSQIEVAERDEASILFFPPAALTGRHIGDLAYQDFFYEKQIEAISKIKKFSKNKKVVIVLPSYLMTRYRPHFGNMLICNGKFMDFNYDGVDISRIPALQLDGEVVTLSAGSFGQISTKTSQFMLEFTNGESKKANLVINIDDSENYVNKGNFERRKAEGETKHLDNVYVYISCGAYESVTDGLYSGDMFICEKGEVVREGMPYKLENQMIIADVDISRAPDKSLPWGLNEYASQIDCLRFIEVDKLKYKDYLKNPFLSKDIETQVAECRQIFKMQSLALARRLETVCNAKAVIGVSGGLDSTIALIVAVKAMKLLGREASEVLAITMPGLGTSNATRGFAHDLMQALGVSNREISIKNAVMGHFEDIGHDPNVLNSCYENAQARERTQILMDIANDEGGIVVGTGDLSEIALGWCTFNGDHMAMYGVNAGIPKTVLRAMAKIYAYELSIEDSAEIANNEKRNMLKEALLGIAALPISPELLPPEKEGEIAQLTEKSIGPYELHDFFLYHTIKNRMAPKELVIIAKKAFAEYSEADIKKYLKIFYERFSTQQFKRNCMPDGVGIFGISLSPRGGLAMPSDFTMREWINELS